MDIGIRSVPGGRGGTRSGFIRGSEPLPYFRENRSKNKSKSKKILFIVGTL